MTRFERRKQESRARILVAALELFDRHGVESTTIDDICLRADVAKRTFFNHFSTREGMIRELGSERLRNLHDVLSDRGEEPAPARLIGFFGDVAAHLTASGVGYRELVGAMFATTGTSVERGSILHDTFLELVKEGVARGEITARHDPAILADVIVGSLVGGIVNWTTDETYAIDSALREVAIVLADLLSP
jgi:AcrR family transcriptional regulator